MIFQFIRGLCTAKGVPKMVRVLNVAEKNDAAKSLADIMSRGRYNRREGFSRFNKIYEFDYNILNMQNCKMTMTSVSGHLLNLEFDGQYRKWYGCNPVTLFDAPVHKSCSQDFVDIKRTLEKEAKGCQVLIIWTDCDREGENIGFEVIQVCKEAKPSLKVYRARFSEITPGAVQRACNNLVAPDKNVSDAVDVRQELDLRIGAAFTRFQTLRLQKVFPTVLADQLISYGSCQFPTLGFVVERYKQVQAFIPEPFWKIKVTHETDEGKVEFSWKRNRLFDHLACLVLYEHCLDTPLATVAEVRSKSKSKWRPVALDTVELEKIASRKLHINAKEAMKIAENLYTKGFISYPRTETNIFPKDLDLGRLVQEQVQDPQWGGFAARILEEGGPRPRNGNKSDQAHPPIHPTKHTTGLQGNDQRLYEYIVRHFLACCHKDAQGQETMVEIDVAEERFTASGLMIIERNYLDVYPYDKWTTKVIPRFYQGETFQPSVIEMNQGETSAPNLLTEADLIALMDKHGIGTDATHAEHIETIKSRLYVGVRPDGKFLPGELGMGLVEGYDAMGFEMSKPHLRAALEADLKEICEGKKNKDVVLRTQINSYREVFVEACQQAERIDQSLAEYFGEARQFNETDVQPPISAPVKPCPKCGCDMVIKTKKDGKGLYLTCMGYPTCKNAIWFPESTLEASKHEEVCDICQGSPHKIKFKFKRGSMPPYVPLEYIGCVGGCDETLNEVFSIKPSAGASSQSVSQSQPSRHSSVNHQVSTASIDSGYNSSSSLDGQNSQNRSYHTQTSFSSPSTFRNTNTRPPLIPMTSSNRPRLMGPPNRGRGGGTGGFATPWGGGDGSEDGNAIVCNCGEDAVRLTTRKEGPNKGRPFFKCAKREGGQCNFFLWADQNSEQEAENRGGGRGNDYTYESSNRSTTSYRGGHHGGGSNTGYSSRFPQTGSNSDGTTMCGCSLEAKLLTVSKDGPNKGRQFYACPKPRGMGCNFFQWADDDGESINQGGRGYGRGSSNRGRFWTLTPVEGVEEVVPKEAQSQGNKGSKRGGNVDTVQKRGTTKGTVPTTGDDGPWTGVKSMEDNLKTFEKFPEALVP